MPLSCHCENDDPDFCVYTPKNYSEMPVFKRRRRCSSCGVLIDSGTTVAKFTRNRCPRYDIEEAIYGDGQTIPLADQYLCETCADLFFSLEDLGFECVMPYEDMRKLVREYAETFSA